MLKFILTQSVLSLFRLIPLLGSYPNNADPVQILQKGQKCLLTGICVQNTVKMKHSSQIPELIQIIRGTDLWSKMGE